jgi:hypothetical protein
MKKFSFIKPLPPRGRRGRILALAAGVVVLLLAVISCGTVSNQVVMLPDVPGAKYIGSKECEQCHEELYRGFQTADHSRLIAEGTNALNAGCESCHGPCSLHSDSGGETKPPFSFTAGRPRTGQSVHAGRRATGPGNGNRLLPVPQRRSRPVSTAQPPSRARGPDEMHGVPFTAQGKRARRRQHRPALPG